MKYASPSLQTSFGDRGATVGPNRVGIGSLKTERNPNEADAPHQTVVPEKIPKKDSTDRAALK